MANLHIKKHVASLIRKQVTLVPCIANFNSFGKRINHHLGRSFCKGY